jgi:hypothetical protein
MKKSRLIKIIKEETNKTLNEQIDFMGQLDQTLRTGEAPDKTVLDQLSKKLVEELLKQMDNDASSVIQMLANLTDLVKSGKIGSLDLLGDTGDGVDSVKAGYRSRMHVGRAGGDLTSDPGI